MFKLVSKNHNAPQPTFWVENYNEEEKEFFLSLGFEEKLSNLPEKVKAIIGDSDTLIFNGTGVFGFWSGGEFETIVTAMFAKYGEKAMKVHQFIEE